MCLAQGPQSSDAGEPFGLESSTLPLSHCAIVVFMHYYQGIKFLWNFLHSLLKSHINQTISQLGKFWVLENICWGISIILFPCIIIHIQSGPEVIKLFSCSTQLSTKFIPLINVKMPTIVGILTFISRINTSYENLKSRNTYLFQHFAFNDSWNFVLSWVAHEKSFITSGPDLLRHEEIFMKFSTLCSKLPIWMLSYLVRCPFSLYGKFHHFSVCVGNLRF